MLAPSSWGTSRERNRGGGEELHPGSAFSCSDPPHRGDGNAVLELAVGGESLRELRPPAMGWHCPRLPSSQALAPRPEPHALETVLPPRTEAPGAGGLLSAWEGRYCSAAFGSREKGVSPQERN